MVLYMGDSGKCGPGPMAVPGRGKESLAMLVRI